jgi:hypothetical protein
MITIIHFMKTGCPPDKGCDGKSKGRKYSSHEPSLTLTTSEIVTILPINLVHPREVFAALHDQE